METLELTAFQLAEVGEEQRAQHWLRGGFPLSFLAENEKDSLAWRKNFIATFLERDLPSFGVGASQSSEDILPRQWHFSPFDGYSQ